VSSPGPAVSMPATLRISICPSPSSAQPSFPANSSSFMIRSPLRGLSNSFVKIPRRPSGDRPLYTIPDLRRNSVSRERGPPAGVTGGSLLIIKKARLNRGSRLAPRNPDYSEDGHLRQGRTRDKDAQCSAMKIGRRDLHTAVEQRQEII